MSTDRIDAYVPLVQEFASRSVLFHAAVAERLGIHVTDLKCLRLLGRDAMTAGALSEKLGLTAAASTSVIDRLEKAGFVVRARDGSDRRRIEIRAVSRKVRKVDALYDSQYRRMSAALATYEDSEFSVITEFLKRTSVVLREETERLRRADGDQA